MISRSRKRLYAIAFSLVIALMVGIYVHIERRGYLNITSPTTALCAATGAMAPAVDQGKTMQFSLQGFRGRDGRQ